MQRRPLIMGVLNLTPDSFSDGGKFLELDAALTWAEQMVQEGADIIDVGGESTRPGAGEVSAAEEADRVLPVIEQICSRFDVRLSIDTRKVEVAEQAVKLGVEIVNDVSGGTDIRMAQLVAREKIGIVLMHMQGTPENMQQEPSYPRGVVTEVRDFLRWRAAAFEEAGVRREQIWVDPGIGFGKTLKHNIELLRGIRKLTPIGDRVVIGTSRKSFLARILGDPETPIEHREAGTLASNLFAFQQGASVFRVHEVGELVRALRTWNSLEVS